MYKYPSLAFNEKGNLNNVFLPVSNVCQNFHWVYMDLIMPYTKTYQRK